VTWDQRLYFPSEGRRAEEFFALKNPRAWELKGSTLPLDHWSRLVHPCLGTQNMFSQGPEPYPGGYGSEWWDGGTVEDWGYVGTFRKYLSFIIKQWRNFARSFVVPQQFPVFSSRHLYVTSVWCAEFSASQYISQLSCNPKSSSLLTNRGTCILCYSVWQRNVTVLRCICEAAKTTLINVISFQLFVHPHVIQFNEIWYLSIFFEKNSREYSRFIQIWQE